MVMVAYYYYFLFSKKATLIFQFINLSMDVNNNTSKITKNTNNTYTKIQINIEYQKYTIYRRTLESIDLRNTKRRDYPQ